MKQLQYKISGMTCSSCVATVTKAIESIRNVKNVTVSLDSGLAVVESNEDVSIDVIHSVLPDKFSVKPFKYFEDVNADDKESFLAKLFPLILILSYISLTSIIINFNQSLDDLMMDFMGIFFIVFSFFKFLDYKSFPNSFAMYDPLAKALPLYGWIYPFIETILGLMFLFRFQLFTSIIITILLLGITTYGVVNVLKNKQTIQCACLGTAIKLPMTVATLIENGIMIMMALISILRMYA
ncbi:copper chaperone [bacterium]|nr:MAG: copper chaperone [bacterium]|tara:strand:- start:47 stop:763 length:717 start_codon:yes stop_codon:yes gene_type:complete